MNENTNYRDLALSRIMVDPKLKGYFGHLRNKSWDHNHVIWKWLAEQRISIIIQNKGLFRSHWQKSSAYHEAAHAVVGLLTHVRLFSVTVIPDPSKGYSGEVSVQCELPLYVSHCNFRFWTWRRVVQLLAAPAAEDMLQGKIGKGCSDDFEMAIAYIQQTIPLADQITWMQFCLDSVWMILSKPAVWKVVQEVAKLLEQHGSVNPAVVEQIFSNWVTQSPNPPGFVKSFAKFQEEERSFEEECRLLSPADLEGMGIRMAQMNTPFMNEIKKFIQPGAKVVVELLKLADEYWSAL